MIQPTSADPAWEQLAPLLDEAMAQLPEKDRDALVLRYFQNKSLREVGSSLGVDEYAAQKRVSRAMEKLRVVFGRRRVALTTVALAALLSANSIQAAPAALAGVTSAAVLAKGTAVGAAKLPLLKGALQRMAWRQFKIPLLTGTAVVFATGAVLMLAGVFGGAVAQPDLQGAWQARLSIGSRGQSPMRFSLEADPVINIVRTNDGYGATMDFTGLGMAGIAVYQFNCSGNRVTFKTLGYNFSGVVNSNATEIRAVQGKPVLKRLKAPQPIPPPLTDSDCAPKSSSPQGRWVALEDTGGGDLTEVDLNIAGQPDGSYRVEMGVPMFGVARLPVKSFEYHPPAVKLKLAGIPFEGRLGGNGADISGAFAVGSDSVPAVFHRAEAAAPPSYAPTNQTDVAGHWAAVWNASSGPARLRLNLGRRPGGRLLATLDSPDEGLTGMSATLVHRSRGVYLGVRWNAMGYSFEGKLTGNTLSGTFRAQGRSAPLDFERTAE